jgi:hypothetical protein
MSDVIRKQVSINLAGAKGVKKGEPLVAYVVDQRGKIVESAPFKDNEALLKSTKDALSGQNRVYIAQAIPKRLEGKANETMLVKAGAYNVAKNVIKNSININAVPGITLKPWTPWDCLITGNVSNTITLDGKEVTVPVCHARVHLVEVEKEILIRPIIPPIYRKIPDWLLGELRNRFGEILGTPPVPDPIGPIAQRPTMNVSLRSLNIETNLQQAANTRALPKLPQEVVNGLTSPSLDSVRQTLVDNHDLLMPYICRWPIFWPWLYETDEDNITYTDSNGHFEYWENLLTEDLPFNIYAWVEVQINGQWVTVYHPPLPCNTFWNYRCGTSININLHDSRIPPCVTTSLPGSIVWVKRIGNGTSVRNLAQHPVETGKPSPFADARGLTNSTGIEGTNYVSPFSGSFPLYIQFGDGFPSTAVTHFRWKYHRVTDADLTPVNEGFTYQQGALSKPYTYQGLDSHGNTVFYTGYFQLDEPLGTGKFYKIPHVNATTDVPSQPTAEWNQDTVSINVDALSLQNGLYEFVLELSDSSGNVINNLGLNVFQVDSFLPSPPNPSSTPAHGVDASYIAPHGTAAAGFRFLMRIDNDPTTCTIFDAIVSNQDGSASTTDTICGFAQYEAEVPAPPAKKYPKAGDLTLLRFSARQPHRFGRFDYTVKKGNSPGYVVQHGGQVPEPDNVTVAGGALTHYQYSPSLTSLLGSCDKAAFAENLYLHAYHTNGTWRLWSGYDSSAVAAFAVEPQ